MRKHLPYRLLFLLFTFYSFSAFAQNIDRAPTISPRFFAADEPITITYDVTGTALSSLSDTYIWLWIPNLNSFNAPSNINPASSNPSATNVAKFTKTSDEEGRTYFTITLTLTDFVGKSKEEILSVGMLLKGNDWSNGQTTDYTTEISTDFQLAIDAPANSFDFYPSARDIQLQIAASAPATIEVFLDDVLVETANDVTSLNYTHAIITDGAVHSFRVLGTTADNQTDEAFYSYTLTPVVEEATLPEGMQDGINYHPEGTSVTLVLVAPGKQNVFVIGDFTNWQIASDYLMKKDGDRFWLTISNLQIDASYRFQYLVDGNIRIADPYAERVASPYDDAEIIQENRYPGLEPFPSDTDFEVSYLLMDRTPYAWTATEYQRPAKEDLVIYELLVRDFTEERTYQAVIDRLDYLQNLGINALQLMPIMEFEGNLSWGYNPAFMLAGDKYYGTEEELKTLIDEAHKRGIAVIFDIALNHAFGRSPLVRLYNDGDFGAPTANNPWLNRTAKHDFNVGYDFNHESLYTQYYVDRVVSYWIENYNIDGYRFDLSKGFTQKNTLGNTGAWGNYDASRVTLLKRMADYIWSIDPDSYVILEHFADNNEEKELSDYGMMLWGNMNHTYRNVTKSAGSLFGAHAGDRGWNNPYLISYMESHDEERVMWDLLQSNSRTLEESVSRVKLAAAFFFTIPGPKMIWQFGEMGYDEELNNDRLGIKPTHWEYLDDPVRKELFDVFTALIHLHTQTDLITNEGFSWDTGSTYKWIQIDNASVDLVAVGNFSTDELKTGPTPFTQSGWWYDYLSQDSIFVADPATYQLALSPGEFHILTTQRIENYIDGSPVNFVLSAKETVGNLERLQVFPNPGADVVNIISQYPIQSIRIVDVSGREMQTIAHPKTAVSLAGLQAGVYFIQAETSAGVQTCKFIKQ
ncbi:alpha-amylase family glycosyl hydrolase [Cytophagales bacterium LB-30]|uniref:Alpha-amylase family glycosyl hydrolase n=1 Tax=Shiella aurantiaca TaxID=3058365 RepID=A0ABT8F241_9BACT|nr:alpha-amylase family glycosyl hydrolase [Shiella aurantiaca]MDN4164106.1 alpha-amylase family glycosyl hydrolase [Shiella aurantiaca]